MACCGIRSENAKKMPFVMSKPATMIAAIRRILPSSKAVSDVEARSHRVTVWLFQTTLIGTIRCFDFTADCYGI